MVIIYHLLVYFSINFFLTRESYCVISDWLRFLSSFWHSPSPVFYVVLHSVWWEGGFGDVHWGLQQCHEVPQKRVRIVLHHFWYMAGLEMLALFPSSWTRASLGRESLVSFLTWAWRNWKGQVFSEKEGHILHVQPTICSMFGMQAFI